MTIGTAPNVSPWDDPAGAHRPGASDFNGAAFLDDPDDAPDPSTQASAALVNTICLALVSLGKVVANARLSVKYASGAPVLDTFTAAPSAPTSTTFTVARTGGGASSGDVTITWPAGTFPTAGGQPTACVNVAGSPAAWNISATNVTNGVRVITAVAGTATDLAFTVSVA
jgi:hypothetical protein